MRRMILFLAITTALLVGVAGAQEGKKAVTSASGVLKITADRDSPLTNGFLALPLVTGKSLLKKAVGQVSGAAAASEPSDVASVEAKLEGGGFTTVVVHSFDSKVPADKLLEALVGVLNSRLRDITGKEYEAAARRLDKENARVEKLAADLRKQHEALIQLAAIHRVEIDPALAAQKRLRIEIEVQSLEVQSHGLKARQEVLQAHIAELGEKVAVDAADDAVLKELNKSVELRKGIVHALRGRFVAAETTRDKVLDASDQLAQAEAEVAKFRARAAQEAGGRRIAQLKTRLDDAAIETAEIVAKRKVLQEQFETARNYSSRVAMKRIEIELLEREYRHRAEQLGKLRAQMQLVVPPVVTFIPLD